MIKKQGNKHHGIMAKLKQYFARAAAHRRATATVKRTRRWRCRPRGRKATSGVSRRNQATKTGLLSAQETSGAVASFAEDVKTLRRWQSSTEQRRRRLEKQRRRTVKNGGVVDLIARLRSKKKPHHGLLHASGTPKTATNTPRSQRKIAGGDSCPMVLFPLITKLPLDLKPKLLPNLCNNSKISKNKSCSKFKVLQLCFYNYPLIRSTF